MKNKEMTRTSLLICILYQVLSLIVSIDIIYHVNEEGTPQTYIGDIAIDSNLSYPLTHHQDTLITFTQLQRKAASGSHLFNVTNSGKLYTTQTLDTESLCTYNKECFKIVKVAVRKAETFIKVLKIKVIIQDINDHQPEFPEDLIKIEFGETEAKGSTKSIPNAVDKDIGRLNSKITYRLKDKSKKFSLSISNEFDGMNILEIILEEKLDRELKDKYMLQLLAKDSGSPPKQGILNIEISVTDINDNRPMFSQKTYNISISDTHHITTPVFVLSATDLDSGQNGDITYNFHQKTRSDIKTNFKLKPNGEMFLNNNFYRNKQQIYKLYIEAKDKGRPSLSSTAMLIINIISNQNNAPVIDIDFVSPLTENSTAISEASKIGSFIAYVMVTDTDSGRNGQIKCNIHHKMFQLSNMGSKEYKISVKEPLDRETIDHYFVSIVCHDMGSPPLKTKKQFSVKVTDVNDVEPHFTKETFQFLTYENQKVDFPIGFINATDPDLGDGGQLTYSIINDNNNDNIPFQLTKYGFISTSQPIDREVKDIYNLQVLVKDNGTPSLNNTANILIEILDKNDNAPYFIFPNNDPYNLDVHYHPHSKKDITILRASDKDTGNNAFLTYGILRSNDKNLFTVNSHTGVLSFSRTVYQNDAGSYELEFIVKDGGTSVQSATTAIILTLFVSNDTSPMLTAVHSQSGNNLNMTWIIIIVAAAVILSVAIVVSITMCVFRCINHFNNSPTPNGNPKFLSQTEMRQILYQTNNPVAITRNAEDIFNRNLQSINPKCSYYSDMKQSANEWKFSTTPRKLPPVPMHCNEDETMTSTEQKCYSSGIMTSNNLNDTLSSHKERKCGWSDGDITHQTSGASEYGNYRPNILPTPKTVQEQETYLEPV
ncbi:protocadherin beta-15-like [Octopus vulgaris]|uniref:Protocadherin beta-15-like n=1 Tax=Octopus vulgaris TaxID=6645 RepID=A0AA36FGC0_OCTVU|nr:protocadherin beta-15-like [Octopus vulgaris]